MNIEKYDKYDNLLYSKTILSEAKPPFYEAGYTTEDVFEYEVKMIKVRP